MSQVTPVSEREEWRSLHDQDNKTVREELQRRFLELFPEGHKHSLRQMIVGYVNSEARNVFNMHGGRHHLEQAHPRALELLAKYGVDYCPYVWKSPPPYGEPEPGACFNNAWGLMYMHRSTRSRPSARLVQQKPPMIYVEGVACGPRVPAMLHAWNARGLEGRTAVDWTWYAETGWIRYFGIPLTFEENRKVRRLAHSGEPTVFLIFSKKHFQNTESYLVELLSERQEKLKQETG